ncbi:hypothetical protein [Arthrobacter sp. ISL-65]|uniref:hypothetical protein n=1 Tax=Arthrobacter sp. ISL-65 TaxID=2819112 RepID=UPI001BEAD43D|nr:hypothetical protein [Arthrobacter sp. ISL-65]MBT2549460.1 hypothetical protein [Arthrobacter sp. ISL-65]
MNPAGRASDPSAPPSQRPLRRLIAAGPVAAFLVVAIALTWLALILSTALLGNAVLGILAELLILLGTAFGATAWADVAVAWGVLLVFAPLFRLLVGIAYLGTGQSLLIVALLHASFNASEQSKLAVFDGAWQQIAAATLLLVVLALLRKFRTLTAEAGHGAAVAG